MASKKLQVQFAAVVSEAHEAGMLAGQKAGVIPMYVSQHVNPLDDSSPVKKQYYVPDGVCGFAWVKFSGVSAFGKWMKSAGNARPAYQGGLQVWVREFGQSMQRKMEYAAAYADVLNKHGIKAHSDYRMD